MKVIGHKQKISMSNYTEYIQYLRDQGYSREQLNIDENSEIVSTRNLGKGSIGTVIDIRCPSGYKMIIAGRAQLSDKAHALALRLANIDNTEIASDIRIKILRSKVSSEIILVGTMFYKDLTITEYQKILPNKIKPYEKFYRFNDGIEINGEEHLEVNAINPDIGIDAKNIKLSLDIDLLEQE